MRLEGHQWIHKFINEISMKPQLIQWNRNEINETNKITTKSIKTQSRRSIHDEIAMKSIKSH